MGTGFIIALVVVLALVLLFFSRVGKDPSKKSNAMLERELALHNRLISTTDVGSDTYFKRLKDREKVADELRLRITGTEASPSTPQSPSDDTPTAVQIRATVKAGYEEGWRRAKAEGKDDTQALETALTSGLLNRIVGFDGWSSVSPDLLGAMVTEMLPFKFAGSAETCRDALIEYAVWCEHPGDANTTFVQDAVTATANKMKASGDDDLLADFRKFPMPWVALIPD